MISIIILSAVLGYFLIYYCSKRVVFLGDNVLLRWAQAHTRRSRIAAGMIWGLGFYLSSLEWGIMSGIFAYFIVVMTVASLVLLLYPLELFKPQIIMAVFAILFTLEILI